MSNMLRERWLRLSGLLIEGEEGGTPAEGEKKEENPHAWYKGGASGDTQGTTVVSEIGFCVSVTDGGNKPTEAKLQEKAASFGAVESTITNLAKYMPAMKLHQKGGTDELDYQLSTAQNCAQKAIEYIETVYVGQTEETKGTKPTITGARHLGVVAASGEGRNTGDVEVLFKDGDGKAQSLKISLKSYENIDEKTDVNVQGPGMAERFAKYYGLDHPAIAKYLRDLKENDENYTTGRKLKTGDENTFRVITDWCYLQAGVSLKDLMVQDIDEEGSAYNQARRDSGISAMDFEWNIDAGVAKEEDVDLKPEFDRQRREFAGERVPKKFGGRGGQTPKEHMKGAQGRKSSDTEEADYAHTNAIVREKLAEIMEDLCGGAWAQSFTMSLIQASLGVIVIAGNNSEAIVVIKSETLQNNIEACMGLSAEQWSFVDNGGTFEIQAGGTKMVGGNYDLGGAAGYGVSAKASLQERYSLMRHFYGVSQNRWRSRIKVRGYLIA